MSIGTDHLIAFITSLTEVNNEVIFLDPESDVKLYTPYLGELEQAFSFLIFVIILKALQATVKPAIQGKDYCERSKPARIHW